MIIDYINTIDNILWTYFAVPFIIVLGLFFTYVFRGAQFRRAFKVGTVLKECYQTDSGEEHRGITPLHAFYMTIGGCIGVANVVAVCTAIKYGGPGALFWMWIAAFFGSLVKYAEVYLGVRFRVPNQLHSYDGGPIYYLKKVFNSSIPSCLFAALFVIYGTEVYMFKVVSDSLIINWELPNYVVIVALLAAIFYAAVGGGDRVGKVCAWLMPTFIVMYCLMGLYVVIDHIAEVPGVLKMVVQSAFSGHAAVGGFAGSSALVAISQGVKRACYTADIGVGYAGVVCSESSDDDPTKQADLSLLGVFLDTGIVCTMSVLIVLLTGVWTQGLPESEWVLQSLAQYFPGMQLFMPILIFMLGYSTIISYFHVGQRCMEYLVPSHGRYIYYVYALCVFVLFSFADQEHALLMMSLCGVCMLLLNLYAIFRLHKHIELD